MSFQARTTKPEKGNKYYIRKENGGYSDAIVGYPQDKDCNVLSNCVGYAYGRFNEIGEYNCCKYLAPVNAENFMAYRGDCKIGDYPEIGACMVWRGGATYSGKDGAGHVAIVEKVLSETEVLTSESGYGHMAFWNQVRSKGNDGNWGENSSYAFQGFIYNPAVHSKTISTPVSLVLDTQTITITSPEVHIREEPSLKSEIVGYANEGSYACYEKVKADGYVWYRIGDKRWVAFDSSWATINIQCNHNVHQIVAGNIVTLKPLATYYNGDPIPKWVKERQWVVKTVISDKAYIDKSVDGIFSINSPINVNYLIVVPIDISAHSSYNYRVKITADMLNIREGPGTEFRIVGVICDRGEYTIINEYENVLCGKWGKLKSEIGWISLKYTERI